MMLDYFPPFRLVAYAWKFWRQWVSAKWLIAGMGLSTLAVLVYSCQEKY